MVDYDVIVIGSGLGGLSSATQLAHKGLRTIVFEGSDHIGGCCSTVEKDGYKFDVGASIVEFNDVIDEFFASVGRKTSDYIDFVPIDPVYAFVNDKGERFRYPVSVEETRKVIEQISPKDAPNWDRFAKVGELLVGNAFGKMMTRPAQTFTEAAKALGIDLSRKKGGSGGGGGVPGELSKNGAFMIRSFESVLSSFFEDPEVIASMSLQSYFVGLPPALCPGYVAFVAYSEHHGVTYPKGGMISIPNGIARAFEEEGGTIELNTQVKQILVENGKAIGVQLADGREVRAHLVVANVNAKTVYGKLVDRKHMPWWSRVAIDSYDYSQAATMVMLGLDAKPDLDAHHTFCYTPMQKMNDVWFDDYLKGRPPEDGYMLISWPTASDPSLAPEGHHILNLVTVAPYNLENGEDWDDRKERQLEIILDQVERQFRLDLRSHIKVAELITPKDFERNIALPEGAVYGLQNDLTATMMMRPRMRSPIIEGLYLAGSSVHLGGGVPVTIGSGVCVGQLVQEDMDAGKVLKGVQRPRPGAKPAPTPSPEPAPAAN